MKQGVHKLIALFMAVLVLASNLSFTIDMHFCGSHLVDFSLVRDLKSCEAQAETPIATVEPAPCTTQISKKSCCSDKQLVVKGQDDLKPSLTDFQFNQQVFIASFVYTYRNLFETKEVDFIPFKTYRPPHLIRDVHLLHESFLI